jgi:hypothetical protein
MDMNMNGNGGMDMGMGMVMTFGSWSDYQVYFASIYLVLILNYLCS